MSEPERVPVLFDTDIGSDIDDAVCLAYLLAQPRCELVGITTVRGQPQRRAMLADAICRAAGRPDVPIYSGCERPLLVEWPEKRWFCRQCEILDRWKHRTDFAPGEGVEFLRRTIRSRPGEIVLFGAGPMTNLAMLFTIDPEAATLLRGLVLMCGTFRSGRPPGSPDWNARTDPHATAVVYRAAARPHTSIGVDVTLPCSMPADEYRELLRAGGAVLEVISDAAEVWFRRSPRITFHDPLAAATIFEPDLCRFEEGRVDVELLSEYAKGATYFRNHADEAPHRVAVEVSPDRFFRHLFSVIGARTPSEALE